MRFRIDGREVTFKGGRLSGDPVLIRVVTDAVDSGKDCGCNYWGSIPASLDSDWEAYLTVCGAIRSRFGEEPDVTGVPNNPDGYQAEGVPEREGLTASISTADYVRG